MTIQRHPAPLAQRTGGRKPRDTAVYLSVETLTREAHKQMGDLHLHISPSRLSREIRKKSVREGRGDIDLRTWFIGYADPTGETAARQVDRERGF